MSLINVSSSRRMFSLVWSLQLHPYTLPITPLDRNPISQLSRLIQRRTTSISFAMCTTWCRERSGRGKSTVRPHWTRQLLTSSQLANLVPLSHGADFVVGETFHGLFSVRCRPEYGVANIEVAVFLATLLANVLVGIQKGQYLIFSAQV